MGLAAVILFLTVAGAAALTGFFFRLARRLRDHPDFRRRYASAALYALSALSGGFAVYTSRFLLEILGFRF